MGIMQFLRRLTGWRNLRHRGCRARGSPYKPQDCTRSRRADLAMPGIPRCAGTAEIRLVAGIQSFIPTQLLHSARRKALPIPSTMRAPRFRPLETGPTAAHLTHPLPCLVTSLSRSPRPGGIIYAYATSCNVQRWFRQIYVYYEALLEWLRHTAATRIGG
jgi:hypothetical protein